MHSEILLPDIRKVNAHVFVWVLWTEIKARYILMPQNNLKINLINAGKSVMTPDQSSFPPTPFA